MAFLKIKNRAFSTLASGISDSDLSLTVATGEGALFPSTYPFHITIEDEILECTNRSTDVLTVTREAEGTTAAAHTSGKAVELRITAAIITEIQKEIQDADGDSYETVEKTADVDEAVTYLKNVLVRKFHDDGILDLPKQSACHAYLSANQIIPDQTWVKLLLDTEAFDIQGEFDSSVISGAADATATNKLHDTGQFTEAESYYLGRAVWNTTDDTYTTVTGKDSDDQLSLTDDIMADTEGYKLYFSRFTAKKAGIYIAATCGYLYQVADGTRMMVQIKRNGTGAGVQELVMGGLSNPKFAFPSILNLSANDYVDAWIWHNSGENRTAGAGSLYNFLEVVKVA